jgi:uncharacterized protein
MALELPTNVEEVVDLLGLIPHPEGGFFRETFRSGATPMASRGQTDFDVEPEHLVATSGREGGRRNALTSIYWMPTRKSPNLPVVMNQSSHVHCYHGGLPFEYVTYDSKSRTVERAVLGPNLKAGHRPQVIVEGGVWKTGRLLTEYSDRYDYCLLGEAVAPGFDVCDFRVVNSEEEFCALLPPEAQGELRPYLEASGVGTGNGSADLDFDSHYDEDGVQRTERAGERL